ncbi:hypothetical protein CSKR_202982 [Clonorchis sinensis]|uniref:Uncharacterized protein n=1 Tax=Clonorchis sinensis TaxID=79923 RepID=A0A8T1M679_CLOSI|nr:hypothetical protein CSKR_202982 [Clonorchis sinensis]
MNSSASTDSYSPQTVFPVVSPSFSRRITAQPFSTVSLSDCPANERTFKGLLIGVLAKHYLNTKPVTRRDGHTTRRELHQNCYLDGWLLIVPLLEWGFFAAAMLPGTYHIC